MGVDRGERTPGSRASVLRLGRAGDPRSQVQAVWAPQGRRPAGVSAGRGVGRAPGMGGEDCICAHPVLMAGGGAGGGPSSCHEGVQVRSDRMPGKDRGFGIETEEIAGGGQEGREERVGRGQRGKELTSGKRSSRRTPRSAQLSPATGRPGPGRRPPAATLLWFGRAQKCGGTLES